MGAMARSWRWGRSHGGRGFTLTELLVTLAVVALLASLSLGVFMALPRRYAHEQVLGSVRALLQRARAAALETGAASVVLAPERVVARVWELLVLLRGEELESSADGEVLVRGARGLLARGRAVAQGAGYLGQGLVFEQPGAALECGDAPFLSPPHGVRLEFWIFPGPIADRPGAEAARGLQRPLRLPIVTKGEEYGLVLREDYALEAWVGRGAGEPRCLRETPPRTLEPGRWQQVVMEWDGEQLGIWCEGLRRELPPPEPGTPGAETAPVPARLVPSAAPLVISSPEPGLSLFAVLDELYLYGIAGSEQLALPPELRLEGPAELHLDADGQLDPLHHDGPVRILVHERADSSGEPAPAGGLQRTAARSASGEGSGQPEAAGGAGHWRAIGTIEVLRSGALR
ncbi:MAG: hypothetical protein KatS3mg102_0569 [Planctomycetota bacterium]|nr:MAG: hypothetical protein KatS3mg102_0569 [Planctomycetota bacterium]